MEHFTVTSTPKYDLIPMIRSAFQSGERWKQREARKVAKAAGYTTAPEWHALVGRVLYGPGFGLTEDQILSKNTPYPGGRA